MPPVQVEQIGARWSLCRWGKVGLAQVGKGGACAAQARLAQLQNRNSWTVWLSELRGRHSGATKMRPIHPAVRTHMESG